MAISAQLVKELRERTGAGLMECKKALTESTGDMDNAIRYLKEKGITKAAEKSGRTTKEGIICVSIAEDMSKAVAVEINCETDFVARTDDFLSVCQQITDEILKTGIAKPADLPEDIQNQLKSLIAKLGENMTINRIKTIDNSKGYITSYIHQGGKIGVLIETETSKAETHQNSGFINMTKDIAMHIAAMNPQGISKDEIDPKILAEQEAIFLTQAKETGKPEKVLQNIVKGKVAQFFKEIVLLDQAFVKEAKMSVQQYIDAESKKMEDNEIKINRFIRFKVGA